MIDENGFIIECNKDMELIEVISIKNVSINLSTGDSLLHIIDENSYYRYFEFINKLNNENAALGYEIVIIIEGKPRIFLFTGFNKNSSYFITAYDTHFEIFDELKKINENQINHYRNYIQNNRNSNELLLELTKLNNEITNSQRELEQKNSEINKLLEKQNSINSELMNSIAIKEKILSILAHDIKSPLSSIIQLFNYALQYKDNNILYDENMLQHLLSSVENAIGLVNSISEWSLKRLEGFTSRKEKVSIIQLVDKVLNMYENIARDKNINIKKDYEENIIVQIDHDMFAAVIRNLLSNAIKFSYPSSSIFIKITKDINLKLVNISIKDTGVGIAEEQLEKLFQVQNMRTTLGTKGEKGTGLGLFICKEFAEANEGKLIVRSKFGEGSEFIFSLPYDEIKSDTNSGI